MRSGGKTRHRSPIVKPGSTPRSRPHHGTPCGKTLLARALHGLLPPLSPDERLEVSRIHSVAGLLHGGLVKSRPFRAPHHTASAAAIVGGGSGVIRPGEVSLAHRGVLFLDELPEFTRNVREVLRQPMESGEVLLARAAASVRLPAAFQLVATMNPCSCGYFGWSEGPRVCRCSDAMVERYGERISGPLIDRFDLQVVCPPVPRDELLSAPRAEPSSSVAARVSAARALQAERYAKRVPVARCNAELSGASVEAVCALAEPARRLAARALDGGLLSARGFHRALRVARTIADLAGESEIGPGHLAEALRFRNLRAA